MHRERLRRHRSWKPSRREVAFIAWVVFLIELFGLGLALLADATLNRGVLFWIPAFAAYLATFFVAVPRATGRMFPPRSYWSDPGVLS